MSNFYAEEELKKETLEVSDGFLFILSKSPHGCNLNRNLEKDSVWLPKLTIAIPDKEKPFIIKNSHINLKGVPSYITRKNSACIWYIDKDLKNKLNVYTYYFVPGIIEEEKSGIIYTLKEGFVPDEKDKDQSKLDINIFGYKEDGFSYADHDRTITANVRKNELGNLIYALMFGPSMQFQYNCEHSGETGLNPRLFGELKSSDNQKREMAVSIIKNLESKVNLGLWNPLWDSSS